MEVLAGDLTVTLTARGPTKRSPLIGQIQHYIISVVSDFTENDEFRHSELFYF